MRRRRPRSTMRRTLLLMALTIALLRGTLAFGVWVKGAATQTDLASMAAAGLVVLVLVVFAAGTPKQ